jgi:coproporphyrinogen III oxidase
VGGIFFDYLTGERQGPLLDADDNRRKSDRGIEYIFEFVQAVASAFLPAYLPIAERRRQQHFTDRERGFQLIRRGRYAEFNLVYDRGTQFGLETRGRAESILMSLPPLVRWVYDYKPEQGSREAEAWDFFRPQDWLGEESQS